MTDKKHKQKSEEAEEKKKTSEAEKDKNKTNENPETNTEKKETEKRDKKESKKTKEKKSGPRRPKKTQAIARAENLPISTKQSVAIGKFIKNKPIKKAVQELNLVIIKKKPVPMKGEIPHKKGIMSGRFPKKASKHFIDVLENLSANANYLEIQNPIISKVIANIGSRPYGRFGMTKRKRTHLIIKAKSKAIKQTNKKGK